MGQYVYTGEAEQVLPDTFDGPRVVKAGDTVHVTDGALDGHPLFEPVTGSEPAVEPEHELQDPPADEADHDTDADGEPQEPTA